MLKNTPVTPTLPATDLNRVKSFYESKLGLQVLKSEDGMLQISAGNGNVISIYQREAPTKADHTVLTFEVSKLEAEMAELEKKGIKFEDYDMPGLKTENHIYKNKNEKAAWFKDSEGNILCIHEGMKK